MQVFVQLVEKQCIMRGTPQERKKILKISILFDCLIDSFCLNVINTLNSPFRSFGTSRFPIRLQNYKSIGQRK